MYSSLLNLKANGGCLLLQPKMDREAAYQLHLPSEEELQAQIKPRDDPIRLPEHKFFLIMLCCWAIPNLVVEGQDIVIYAVNE